MTTRWVVSIAKARWYAEHQPEYLTAVHVTVYDQQGNPTVIKAYKLDQMLAAGFLEAPPGQTPPEPWVTEAPQQESPEPVGVRSQRLFPRRTARGTFAKKEESGDAG